MRYRPLGNTGLLVSEIALGTVELGMDYGFRGSDHYARPDRQEAERILHRAVETGINLFDTARAYGDAEAIIGKVLPALNPRPYVTTKCTADEIVSSVEMSLRTLGVDTIDLLQIHNATEEVLGRAELHETLERLREQGKIRFAGASIYGETAALMAVGCVSVRTLQVPYNFLDRSMEAQIFPLATARRMGVLVRSAFLRGVLTPRIHDTPAELAPLREAAMKLLERTGQGTERLAELALRFCLANETVSTVLAGVRSIEELDANVMAAALGPLEPEVVKQLHVEANLPVNPNQWKGLI